MRGKKAKRIRKMVYGDNSQRKSERVYIKDGKTIRNDPLSLRAIYQMAKKAIMKRQA